MKHFHQASELRASRPSDLDELACLEAALIRHGADADAQRIYPAASLELLADYRAIGLTGSDGPAAMSLMDFLRFIGRADLSVGRLLEGHINAVQLIEWYGTPAQRGLLRDNLRANRTYGVWATEPPPGVSLEYAGQERVLAGGKVFASGAGHIDFAIITVRQDNDTSMVVIPANDPARANVEGWRVRGMRATLSGSYDCAGLPVTDEQIIGVPGQYNSEPRFTAGAWRFLAVHLGGIEALVTEMRSAMSDVARADPLQRLKFANAVEQMRTARFWVAESARLFEANDTDAPSFVRMARGVVEKAAMTVMADAARIVGTRSAFDGQRIDKISRDLSLYLRQAGQDYARDQAALAWLDHDISGESAPLW